jgi:hypothetical protein
MDHKTTIAKQMALDLAAPGATDKTAIFVVSCDDSKVLVIDVLSPDSKDLLCYNYAYQTTMHLKREDLKPQELVDASVAAILLAKKR